MSSISHNLAQVLAQIRTAEQLYSRPPYSVSLLAVTKGQPLEKIQQAIQAGQTAFGENYLQEALEKITALANPHLIWHFIGPIQSNKTQKIATHFSWVHSVSTPKIAERLNAARPDFLPPLNICLQVNIDQDVQKSGAKPEDVLSLAQTILSLPRLSLRGLMTIPTQQKKFFAQREPFHHLALLKKKLAQQGIMLDTLSMGMSDDMEAAIAEGSTLVRIGTAIFGERNKNL